MPESRTDLSLAASLELLAPLVNLLMHDGVTYPRFVKALKKTFLESARTILEAHASRANDSSISALTGIHRKDVREWRSVGEPRPQAKTFGAVMEVFTRWTADPHYCDRRGRPRVLDRAGSPASFEALAASVSKDVHPRTVLRELVRLGVARHIADASGENDRVSLCADAFVPKEGSAEMLRLFADNVGDHLAAAVHNLISDGMPMLEQSVFADKLRPESAAALEAMARQIWSKARHDIVQEASRLCEQDRGLPEADRRVRVGMYLYQGSNFEA